MPTYVAVLHKDPGSAYGVIFPEVPGCFSAGETLDEAAAMAAEALALHLTSLDVEGAARPEPRGSAWVQAHEDAEGAIGFLAIPAPLAAGRT